MSNSSNILFEHDPEPQKNQIKHQAESHSTNKSQNYQKNERVPVKQITPNLIRVKSLPKIKNRAKLRLNNQQFDNQSSLRVFKVDQQQQAYQNIHKNGIIQDYGNNNSNEQEDQQDSQDYGKSQTTKPTKTIQQRQYDQVQDEIKLKKYQKMPQKSNKNQINNDIQIKESKIFQPIQPPRIAKRELQSSGQDSFQYEGERKQKQHKGWHVRRNQQKIMKEQQQQYQEEQIGDEQDEYEYQQTAVQKQKIIPKYKQNQSQSIKSNPSSLISKPQPIQFSFSQQNLQKFINTPLKPGYQLQCLLTIQSGFLGIGTKYHLKQKYDPNILISAKKQIMSISPMFLMSMNKQNHSRRHQDFVGIMESNFSGTSWTMKSPIVSARFNQGEIVEDLKSKMIACYDKSVLGSQSIRNLQVYIIDPSLPKSQRHKIDIQQLIKTQKKKGIIALTTLKPKLLKGKYQIDFHGLAKQPSNKNFILEDIRNNSEVLIFAKQKQDSYQMNVRYPLTIAQGFALCLASLEGKLFVN